MYNYWLDRSESVRAYRIKGGTERENFCHYWRVVLFWAPLYALVRGAERVFTNPWVLLTVGLAIVGFLVFSAVTWSAVLYGILLGLLAVYLLAGIFVGAIFGEDAAILPSERKWFKLGLVLLFPTALPVFLLVRGTGKMTHQQRQDTVMWLTLSVVALILAGLGYLVFQWIGFWLFVLLGIIAAGAVALYFFGEAVADFIEGWRMKSKEKANARAREEIRNIVNNPPKRREPSRLGLMVGSFFRTLGDFVILLAQVIRVNKWKICPLVEIPKEEVDSAV
jgi:hypothetical protein